MVPRKISKTRSRLAIGLIVLAHVELIVLLLTEHRFASFGDPRPLFAIHAGVLVTFALLVAITDRRKIWWTTLPVLGAVLALMAIIDIHWTTCLNRPKGAADVCSVSI